MPSKKRKKPKTIGEMTQSRGEWTLNPVTRVVQDKKKKQDRKRIKEALKTGVYE